MSIITVTEQLRRAFSEFASRTAIRDDAGALTYAELSAVADALAACLQAHGVRPGDHVAVMTTNSRFSVAAYLGAWKAGAIVLPLNPGLTAFELGYILEHAQPTAAIAAGPALASLQQARAACPSIRVVVSDVEAPDVVHAATLPAAAPVWHTEAVGEVCAIMYTSGTSGRPKGVLVPHVGVAHSADGWRERIEVTRDDVVLGVLPFFHVYSCVMVMQCTLLTGATLVPIAGFGFPDILRVLSQFRVTLFPGVPPMMLALAERTWDPAKYDLSALRMMVSGGAPLPNETWQRVTDRLGVPLYNGYGCTETSPLISMGPIAAPHRVGSCGYPLPGVTVHICDETGAVLPAGQQGEVRVLTPGLMKGYYNNPEATAAAIVDGWYLTGDVGYLDEDGYLYITDRIKDVIFVAGMNVYPREIEEAIHAFPTVARAAVVRMMVKGTGEAPHAYVVPLPGQTVNVVELLAFLRTRLASYKVPRAVEIVDTIPTTASGKVMKYKLAPTEGA